MKNIRLINVLIWIVLLTTAICTILIGPVALSIWRAQLYEHRAGSPELQRIAESGPESEKILPSYIVFPYSSISLDTGPCFGSCPVYLLTLYRDGHALLVTDHLLPIKQKTFTARISPVIYARATQLVFLARAASHQQRYAGNWTDDSQQTVTAKSSGGTWEVSDYGGVSPPEVWALIEILRSIRDNVDWQPIKAAG